MGDIGIPELLIILAIVLVLFGPARLAGMGKTLGLSIREFRQSMREDAPTSAAAAGDTTLAAERPAGVEADTPHARTSADG